MGVSKWAVIPYCATQGAREHSMAAQRRGSGVHPGGGEPQSKPPRMSLKGRAFQKEGPTCAEARRATFAEGGQPYSSVVVPGHSQGILALRSQVPFGYWLRREGRALCPDGRAGPGERVWGSWSGLGLEPPTSKTDVCLWESPSAPLPFCPSG